MKKAISNASPLIFLARINRLDFLSAYNLIIPKQVYSEIRKGGQNKKADASVILQFIKKYNIDILDVRIKRELPESLGKGEKAVISLALKEGIEDVFLDERRARIVSRFYKLKPKGTLGILWEGKQRGLITDNELEKIIFDLVKKGYRIKEEILIEFLKNLQ